MNLTILQLSDIHISAGDNPVLSRADAIKAAVQAKISVPCAVLLVCSGDTAYSGTKDQYVFARGFFDQVIASLKQISGIEILGTVIVPGNHDCDFSVAGDARPVLLSSVATNLASVDLDGESIQQLLKVQNDFFAFEQGISNEPKKSRLSWVTAFQLASKRILFRCLNTALLSRLVDVPGQLFFPPQAIPEQDKDADFVVTLFHHPYGWLAPDNSRELRRRIESISDLVLTGHEHDGDAHIRIGRGGEETSYVEGSALQAVGETGFNLIFVDLVASTCQISPYRWAGDMYEPIASEARVFTRKQSLIESRFDNNAEFVRDLHDLGTGFSHHGKDLTLRDLFVYPELRIASISSKGQAPIQSWNFLSFVLGREHLNIAGPPISGKSTLARALYIDLQRERDLVPVLLDGGNLKVSSTADFDKAIEHAFVSQYHARLYERFRQLDRQKKVLLIDDWHRSRLSAKAKRRVLNTARIAFGKVIVFSDCAGSAGNGERALSVSE